MPEVVLITGCSSGIGAAVARVLAAAGHVVYATARHPDSLGDLAALGCRTLALDVTDDASMAAAVRAVQDAHGAVDVLVNNAGYGQYGPIEQVPLDEVRRQFETNVFGLVRLTQLVLPAMRARRHGRIVNVSSMGGRTTLPGGGYYHASKYAVEAISDALRLEVRQFGVDVVLIEPGVVRTPWAEVAMANAAGATGGDAAGGDAAGGGAAGGGGTDGDRGAGSDPGPSTDPYAGYMAAVDDSFARAYSGPLARLSISADDVAKVIGKAVSARRPRSRYLISPMAKSLVLLDAVLPDRVHDAVLRQQYRLP